MYADQCVDACLQSHISLDIDDNDEASEPTPRQSLHNVSTDCRLDSSLQASINGQTRGVDEEILYCDQFSEQDFSDSQSDDQDVCKQPSNQGTCHGNMTGEDMTSGKTQKIGELGQLLCGLGFVCSLTNLVQYPCLAAKHGGGVFGLAYAVLMLLCGVPMVYLEMSLGQFTGTGPVSAWNIIPLFSGLAFAMVLISCVISVYHNMYIGWSLYYLVISLSPVLPWSNSKDSSLPTVLPNNLSTSFQDGDAPPHSTWFRQRLVNSGETNDTYSIHDSPSGKYFHNSVLRVSDGIHILGAIQPFMLLSLFLAWIAVFFILILGFRSLSKVVYLTVPLTGLLLFTLGIKVGLEEGAVDGIQHYLTHRWAKLVDPVMWWDAGRQLFFSLGLGTGCLTSLGTNFSFHSKCHRNAVILGLGNVISSVFSGVLIFAILGALGYNDELDTVISHDTDIGFLLFPDLVQVLGAAPVWSGLFYLLLVVSGLTRQCVLVQTVVLSLLELCHGNMASTLRQTLLLVWTCIFLLLSGFFLTTQGGLFGAQLLNVYVCKWMLFFLCLCECVVLMWVYGSQRYIKCVCEMIGGEDHVWWRVMWSYVTPAVILMISSLTWWSHSPVMYGEYRYPSWFDSLGWSISSLPLAALLFGITLRCCKLSGTLAQRLHFLIETPLDWGRHIIGHSDPTGSIPEYIACSPEPPPEVPSVRVNMESGLLYNMLISSFVADSNLHQVYQDTMVGSSGSGYLRDLVDVDEGDSLDSDSTAGDENKERGNWTGQLEFIVSCLGYVVGLGNVWRFPYLVYRNGGGAFFIPYLIMLVFCGIPLVFMELSFGQFASLGPITIWKAVPLFKGIGFSMVIIAALVCIYYNMVVAWSMCYLFSSMTAMLPWKTCDNDWNTQWCSRDFIIPKNCSENSTMEVLMTSMNMTFNSGSRNVTTSGEPIPDQNSSCHYWLQLQENKADNSLSRFHGEVERYNSPSEEYFYLYILNISRDISVLDTVQWKLVLCLLLAWVLIFICLFKGIKSSGKVMYLIVSIPYLTVLVLLVRGMTMPGHLDGIKYYVTPDWKLLGEARVWRDAAAQVFFSLSVCWGGLATLASYNKFHNNIYRDAILICVGDTLMSVLSGFAVFAMIGVLGKQLNTTVENVIQSDVGLAFIAYPEAISHLPISPLWSVLFFLMLSTLGLSTQLTTVETIITAIMDENMALFKKRRILMLLIFCVLFYLCGIPLTTQGGIYWLQLMDEYLSGWPVMVLGIAMCLSLAWLYGVKRFSNNIRQMTGERPSWWWRSMWCVISPLLIIFILVFSMVDYAPAKFGTEAFPGWAQVIGFFLTILPILPIPIYAGYKLAISNGTFIQRLKSSIHPEENWGPALERFWDVEYMPTVSAVLQPLHDLGTATIQTVTDRIGFTTVGIRAPCLSQSSVLTGSTNLNSPVSRKHYDSIRQQAILQRAYSSPQCNTANFNSSAEKLPVSRQNSSKSSQGDYIVVRQKRKHVAMCDASTQTDPRPKHKKSQESVAVRNTDQSVVKGSAAGLETTHL